MNQQERDKMADLRFEVIRAQQRAQISQRDINNRPRRRYAMIVATDLHGAFSKDGQIPWHYKEDFLWFKKHTENQICVMGRTTYDDINERMGAKGAESVLPNRQCFVVTSKPLPRDNATAIARIGDLDKHLPVDDMSKTVFFCGGERIYSEGIAYCNEVLLTVVNKEVEGDRFIPREYILSNFDKINVQACETTDDLRFVTYRRKI